MTAGGHLVLTDLFSAALLPTLLAGHRGRARMKRQADTLLTAAGFRSLMWHNLEGFVVRAVTATR